MQRATLCIAVCALLQTALCAKNGSHYSFVIVGAGPAGVQWGTLLRGTGVQDYLILERNAQAGSFFQQYPRARNLISANRRNQPDYYTKDFGLRHDWHSLLEAPSFTQGRFSTRYNPKADELARYLQVVAKGLNIQYNTTVEHTEYLPARNLHALFTDHGVIYAERLIIATGLRMRDVPECLQAAADEYNVTVYTYENYPDVITTDEDFCRGKHLTIFGSGNAAFETAEIVAPCARGIKLIYKNMPRFSFMTHYVGDVRVLNAGIMDRYHLKSLDDVTGFWDVCSVNPRSQYYTAIARAKNRTEVRYDLKVPQQYCSECNNYRLRLRGQRGSAAIFAGGFTGMRKGLVDLTTERERFPKTGSFWRDPSQPNRFYAGNLMHGADYRRSAGGFIHGFRYNIRAQFRHMMRNYAGTPWPTTHFEDPVQAYAHAITRIQNSSGLYQMSDFMTDAISLNDDGSATYWYEIPEPWVEEEAPEVVKRGMTLHFEFSQKERWDDYHLSFSSERISNLPGLFLHPVITPFLGGQKLERCNIGEDGPGSWVGDVVTAEMHFVILLAEERIKAAARGGSTDQIDLEETVLQRMDGGVFGCAPPRRAHPNPDADACEPYFYMHPAPISGASIRGSF